MLKLTTNSAEAIREHHGNADLKELVLQLYRDSNLAELAQVLRRGYPSIKRVKVVCSRDHDRQSFTDRSFWEAIGSLEELQDLELANFCGDFPVSLIVQLLRSNPNCQLERLLLHQLYFTSDSLHEDLPQLTESIRRQSSLKSFDLCGFFKMQNSIVCTKICSAFVDGLSSLTALESVFIDSDRGLLDHEPFERLCRSASIQKLHLRDVNFINRGNVLVAQALEKNTSLKELRMYNRQLDAKELEAWFQVLRNHTSLQYFRLWTRYTADTKDAELDLANALKENATLKRCHFFHVDVGDEHVDRNGKAFAEMLETNLTLTNLTYSRCMTSTSWPKIKLYLDLNTKDRRRLKEEFDTIPRGDWVDILSEVSDKIDYLFHFIQLNPLLCQNDG